MRDLKDLGIFECEIFEPNMWVFIEKQLQQKKNPKE